MKGAPVMQDQEKYKKQFAQQLLKLQDPFKAALSVFPQEENLNFALKIANEWPNDFEVLEAKSELLTEGFKVHDKEQLRAELIDELRGIVKNTQEFATDRVRAAEAVGKLAALIEKPETNINANVQNVTNRVMIVREQSTTEEWEANLLKQQDALTNASIN